MARDSAAPLIQLSATPIPTDLEEIPTYLEGELNRIWAVIGAVALGHLPKTYTVPANPRDGDTRYADGTSWNPGAGEGAYIYYNATWNKMG